MVRASLLLVPVLMLAFALAFAFAAPFETKGIKLDVTAGPEKPVILLGEPTWVLFKVANASDRDLRIMDGGDYRNRLGRPDSFKVEITGPDGKRVSQPDSGMGMGGITHAPELPSRGEYVFRLFLPHWATFNESGEYKIRIRRTLETVPDDGKDPFRVTPDRVDVETSTTIAVAPRDAVKMGKIIDELGIAMLKRDSDGAERAGNMLAAIHDERVVPYYAALARLPRSGPRSSACDPLGKYASDEAFDALKELAATAGADVRESATTPELAESAARNVRHSAVHALGVSPHPKALDLFRTFADDPYMGVRMTVLHRAAALKTPKDRAIIRTMTRDDDERVRNEAIRYRDLLAKEDAQ